MTQYMTHTMNMTYRSKKQITKLMTSSSQLLSILMSKFRVCLENAWEQAGRSRNLVPHEITVRPSRDYGSFITTFLRPFSSKRAELERRFVVSMLLLLVVGVNGAWGQGPVEITTDADENGIIEDSEKKFYLIQTNAFQSFYIAPQSNNNITTNNILGEYMLWYFLDAGTDGDTQYYYIVNNSTGKYVSHADGSANNDTKRAVPLVVKDQSNDESCKFKLVLNESKGADFYNIIVKGSQTYYALNKRGGSVVTAKPIQLTNKDYVNDIHSLWKFIPFNGTFVWPTPPFTPSTDLDKHYYKIRNIEDNTYYVSTDATSDKVTYASTESDRMVWYLKEVPVNPDNPEPWFKYYYIINPSTGGRYMYYQGTATNGGNQTNAVSVKEYNSENEDRYQFVVIQAARGDGEGRVECYAIIPKLLTDKLWGSNSIGLGSISDGAYMGIISSRSEKNKAQWKFEVTDYSTECATPTITFSNTTGKVTITTTTSNPSIYYTTNGTEPSSTNGTLYVGPFDVTEEITIKAIVTREGFTDSEVTTETFYQVATPTIQNNGSNAVSITSATEGATIYYTTNGSNPTTSTTEYTAPLTENISGVTIRAIAVKDGMINSAIGSGSVTLSCATPVFTRNGNSLTISCPFPATGVSIYYTKNGGEPTTSSTPYTGAISVDIDDVIKAIAVAEGYNNSEVATKTVYDELLPIDGKYYINNQTDFEKFVDMASSTQGAAYHYILKTNVDAGSPITVPFTGVFEVAADENGNFYTISGLTHPLFNTINGGVVKNAIFSGVDVKGNGTICNEASGATKIYNCGVLSGTVTGSGNVGGLVGHITSGSSVRVINCYNFAKVIGGSIMGGIVGNNEGTVGAVRIAMCMMYGDMPGGTSPVYAGNHTSNASNFTEYNYWRSKANLSFTTYNDQLAIDNDEYLTRFPFYRHILNTHRELAAYFLFAENTTTGSVSDITAAQVEEIGHWSIDKSKAIYPIIEKWEKNTKKVLNAPSGTTVSVRKGDGTPITSLKVKVIIGANTYTTFPGTETELTLPITDMDEENHDYTWGKVVLPFANEFEVNTDYSKICTGWKITAVTGGNGAEYSNYNMSDRECTDKDLYSNTGFIFAQGGYYIVPYNVTKIEITANFANAFYLSDESYDISYSGDNTTAGYKDRTGLGGSTSTTYHDKPVYNTLAAALGAIEAAVGSNSTTGTTHEQAVVLVGNYHQDEGTLKTANGYTIMSIDADNNQEPDYAIYSNYTTDRPAIPPTRFDFVAMIPVGMSAHVTNSKFYPNIPIFKPRGWFELTETSLLRADQFELDSKYFDTSNSDKKNYRCIINGGYFTQMVRSNHGACTNVSYFQIGGKAYVKEFYPGNHSAKSHANKLVPVNVTGGEIEQCFMTGYGKGTAYGPDIYFWCAGGKIGKFLGAYMEKPRQSTSADGNVNLTAKIDHAIIGRFFGGGTSPSACVTGNINVTIDNSRVDFYCGGPEFGNMTDGKTVKTEATNTYFKEYYGAGFGGTGITYTNDKDTGEDLKNKNTFSYPGYFNECYVAAGKTDIGRLRYKSNYGIGSCYKFEFVMHSRGNQAVSRFFTGYARFSLASTGNVTNILNGCEIEKDFYGAGCQGKVNGTVTSTLTGCTVHGSAFGGGYKAESNQVDVYPATSPTLSTYNSETCLFTDFGTIAPETYEWVQGTSAKNNTVEGNKLYTGTDVTLTDLGNVTGAISLTIDGGSVTENVYGGGNESKSLDNTTVVIQNGAQITGNVYGGGNLANVEGNTSVNITGGTITENVFGGGKGETDEFSCSKAMIGVNNAGAGADLTTDENKNKGTTVTISNGQVNGNVYGGGEVGRVEWNTQVKIGVGTGNGPFAPVINGSVFGAGKGKETHGYAALVRGNSTVTVQGNAKVLQNVYGGGELATVGRYWVKGVNDNVTGAPTAPTDTPDEMPYQTMSGGKCTVVVQGSAQVGPDSNVPITAGHVFGASKGVTPNYVHTGDKANWSKRMVDYNSTKHTGEPGTTWDYYPDNHAYVWEYFTTEDKYLEFLQTLALVTGTDVTIGGGTVKGSVFGGSESGYVQDNTDVKVTGGTIGTTDNGGAYYGNVYGGGKGDAEHTGANQNYVAAGLVKGNTKVTISNGTILHNVYGGGAYGSVGEFTYVAGMPTERVQNTTGGKAEVIITGGTIGTTGEENGMVFGSSRGDVGAPGAIHDKLAWVFDADVKIGQANDETAGPQINGSVYGGGENGHVFRNADVYIYSGTVGIPTGQEIDNQSGASYPYRGNVYGGGCGTDKYTDTNDNNNKKYNPLAGIVQGNTTVNISGGHVVHNVYGAGAMGSVGTASVATSGKTTVTVSGGRIGYDGNSNNDGNIFGAARGDLSATGDNLAQVRETEVNIRYATTPTADNQGKTEQLIAGSVFGGGEAGKVKGSVAVNMTGGLVLKDVYGGGALAHTQTSNWDASANNNVGGWADTNQKSALNTTTVRLTGGTILGEAYGGALGQKNGVNGATSDIAAYVYGDVLLDLNGTTSSGETGAAIANTAKGCVVGQIFGCNNINGSPKGDVMVHVYATQNAEATQIANTPAVEASETNPAVAAVENAKELGRYDVSAVYGGGNMAAYVPVTPYNGTSGSKTQVIIEGCTLTSIETVYGGGNAAAVPETNVVIKGAYEIDYLFGGGNGKDKILINNELTENPGADIGQYHNGTEMVTYGTGNANSRMEAGLIHEAYGGSNTKGVLKGSINQVSAPKNPGDDDYCCELVLEKIVGAGKYADIDGDVNMTLSCQPSTKVPLLFAGADEANVNGNITLNITNGNFGKVFGGNNLGGAVKGKITVNVEETGCQPIKIDELYLGGNEAAYSIYGYYESEDIQTETGKKILKPRTSATDSRLPVKHDGTEYTSIDAFTNYAQPELNIISCTYIGEVFGGGLGAPATMYANPSVNVNLVKGDYGDNTTIGVPAMMTELNLPNTENSNHLGIIGNVYGGGNAASVIGETHVNIGTEQTVGTSQTTVLGAYITGNVYGGGKLANVGEMDADIDNITAAGRTFVNIGAKKTTENNQEVWQAVAAGKGVTIKGNVYGGGKGEATTFKCEKAMVAGSTNVMIGNGTVNGVVYGGGQLGRVEAGTTVTIGIGDGEPTGTPTSEPQINGDVYGAGAGANTHGYAALVRGISEVTIQGNAKVGRSVYGGGQIASVGRYKVKKGDKNPSDAPDDVEIGMPYTLADSNSKCIVTVKGYAEIGPDNMQMKAEGGPDDTGYVFGAGKGVLPYEGYAENENPVRWTIDDKNQYVQEVYTSDKEELYLKYVGTLALATETEVTIGGHAFVKGSVYGGSENGHVQHNTKVKIEDHCQIGNGWNTTTNTGVNARYNENLFVNPATATAQQIETAAASIYECAHWDYGHNKGTAQNPVMEYLPYDKYVDSDEGSTTASDGHTFFGNVFGGGSGLYPYKSRKNKDNDNNYIFEWLRTAGRVEGNTNVIITGGHILTSVYGGCELTDVGNGVSVETNKGRCFVKMSGGTLGVPRTLAQIAAHPVTCYLFGAGKGDQRVHFDQWTNVGKVRVEINDSISQPIIYGSAFGGGEDGHVLGDVSIDIKTMNGNDPVIGTWGTSYVDGNVFGGGRGFGGDALTAGVVSGNVYINISGGKMLGSIYGGGRLGSVGTYLVPSDKTQRYGQFIPDGKQQTIHEETIGNGDVDVSDAPGVTHGHVTINISGGTIGNSYEYVIPSTADNTAVGITETDITKWTTTAGGDWDKWKSYKHIPNTEFDATSNRLTHTKGGNVFAGAMGRFYGLDGSTVLPRWIDLGKVKSTKLNISGSAVIKSSIYGGGELGWTSGTHTATIGGEEKDVSTEISISGGTIGTEVKDGEATKYTFGSVFGGGYGSSIEKLVDADSKETNPKFQAGRVKHSTKVDISGGTVLASVYGGGEVASVGYGFQSYVTDGVIGEDELTSAAEAANTYVSVSGNAVIGKAKDETNNIYYGGATMGNVYGGGSGNRTIVRCGLILGNTNVSVTGGTIYHNIYGGGAYGSVGNFEYDTQEDPVHHTLKVYGVKSLKTTGTGTAKVTITGGNIGIDGRENGMVFGSSRGDVIGNLQRDDYMAWVNEANVTIGTSGATTGPTIAGSVYGSGENGHTLHNTNVAIHSGTIGILTGSTITGSSGKEYNGAEYPYRGNVYGGGCGTDTYTEGGKTLYNPLAGLVKGNATVTMDGGRVARTIYGGGAMGSVGTFTYADATYHTEHTDVPVGKPYSCTEGTGLCTVTISGGSVGPDVLAMPNNYGNVFGAGRGEVHDPAEYANLETSGYVNKTLVTVSGSAFVRGSVYGGAESGHVLADTHVKIQGGQIGCGKTTTEPYGDNVWAADYTPTDATDLECASWPYEAPYTPYDKFADGNGKYSDGSSADNAHPTGTDGHTFYGNVFGGGSGYEPYAAGKWLPTAGWVEGNTTVEITGGHILTSVYGGNEMTDVGQGGVRKMTDLDNETPDMFYDITKPGGKCTVKMSGGTLGVPRTLAQIAAHPVTCYLFGAGKGDQRIFFNKTTNVNNVEVEISGTARIYGSVFGGGEDGHVMRDVKMTIKDNAYIGNYGTSYVEGNVFGGGRGFSGEALTAGNVGGCVNIDIQGGTMLGSVYGGGRLGSVGHGLYLVNEELTIAGEKVKPYGILRPDNQDDRGRTVAGFERGNITINISGGTIGNNIEYKANPTAADKQKMPTTTFDSQNHLLYTRGGNVFAGCMGRLYSLENELLPLWPKLGRCRQTTLNITGGTIKSNVYGGAELGVVEQNTSVNITGGQVGTQIGTGSGAYYYGSVFGSGKGSVDNITYPSTTPEAEQIPISEAGTTGGNVEVHLNKGVEADTKGGIVRKVFGCNDMNGTPKGDVLVHIHATQSEGTDNIATKPTSGYDVDYVFGGGNNADYVPTETDAKQSTEVIIEGCDLTSIEEVYGGGYGAATPGTKVEIRGTKIIDNVFGGGYGAGQNNPGANVGIRTDGTTEYGNTGAGVKTAVVRLMAGNVHNVYGGSNTKGDIRGGSSITNIDKTGSQGTNLPCCDNLNVNNIYGGGKDAEMAGGAEIVLGCMPNDWISEIYAGAENADVGNDVSLTLTSGKFGRVFGGNKSGGKLDGQIEVNIEESETCGTPIIIGELYGGGNLAPYSIYGYNDDGTPRTEAQLNVTPHNSPRVNVRRFTSIGNIFGGGLGANAVMVGSPTVNINEVAFDTSVEGYEPNAYNPATDNTKPSWIGDGADQVKLWPHTNGQMGVIGNVFGGGNAAQVIGDTYVNIGTESSVKFESIFDNTIEGNDKRVSKSVVGADIRGNVFGGGNNAAVTGNTNVNIGKKEVVTPAPEPEPNPAPQP